MKRNIFVFLFSIALSSGGALWAEERLTPAEMLKRLQERGGEVEVDYEEPPYVWPDEVPKDLPLYPEIEHQPIRILDGYYRFNIHAPTSDRTAIIETLRAEAKKKGWTAKLDQAESGNIHTFHFSKGNGNLIVKVSNDGVETKMVFFEYMTDDFMKRASKSR